MAKRVKLFISGQKGDLNGKKLSGPGERVKNFLDRSQDGELFKSYQVSELAGVHISSLVPVARELPAYTHPLTRNKRFWGKPATVAQLKRETER